MVNQKLITTIFSVVCVVLSLTVKAQKFNIKNFTTDDGLPQTQILDIMQDHTGALWLATNGGGVCRFDGNTFEPFTTREGLNSNHVFSVYEDESNTVWIGTLKGLNKYVNKQIVKVEDSMVNQAAVHTITKHSNGELWLGMGRGMVIYNGKRFEKFGHNSEIGNFQVWSIKEDKYGNTWIATLLNGIFRFDGKNMLHFGTDEGLNDIKNRDMLITGNKLWVATYHGINVLDLTKPIIGGGRVFDTLKLNGKPFLEGAYRFYKDVKGIIWIGCSSGVTRVENNKGTRITKNNGLCNSLIDAILRDREGNMWLGSFAGGLSKYRNNLFININEQQGLTNNNVTGFLKDKKENMWVATWGGGVSKLDYEKFKNRDTLVFQNFVQQKEGLVSNTIFGMCEDKNGNIWFTSSGSGVSRYDGRKFINYDIRNGLDGLRNQAILADRKGYVWIGSEAGVDKWDGEKFILYGPPQGFSAQGVSTIYEDDLGNLWFGAADKIVKYDGKLFTNILRSEGFSHIKNIVKDKYGNMWISTDAGMCVYNGKYFRTIGENDGLISNSVNFIKPDQDGNLWIGTNKGIDKLNLEQFINQKAVVIKHYGKEEGFTGVECNQNSFYSDSDGKLWIGTTNGIMIYNPKEDGNKNYVEPQTQITGIKLFLVDADLSKYSDSIKNGLPVNLKLAYDENHITFEFIGISQTDPTKVKYQFKLEGADNDWSPEQKETFVTFSNLSPGKYNFVLKAENGDGVWNAQPVTFRFEIISPLWKRPWFYLSLALLGLVLIYLLIKIRERRLTYSKRLLERQVSLRTKELFEEKEKLQMLNAEIDEKNKDITDSIHYAKRIQKALLPTDTSMKQLFPDSFVFFRPKDIVSGDFYWMEQWGHQTLLAAVDCTGHGVPGAFMSIVGHNILSHAVNVLGLTKPSLILNETNKQLSRKLNQHLEQATVMDGMDIALLAINYTKSTMEFAGANNPVWLIRDNEFIEIKGDKFPIGAYLGNELQKFTHHEWELQKGDYIYIFTDGYADQFGGEKGKKFKNKEFQQMLMDNHKKPLIEQRNVLEKTFDTWRGSLEQVDDVLVIGIRI